MAKNQSKRPAETQVKPKARRQRAGSGKEGRVAQYEEPDRLALQRAVTNPALAKAADILALQRTAGNRAVQRLLAPRDTAGLTQRQGGENGFDLDDETTGRINRARGGGQLLDAAVQTQMGETMGYDFSSVRVHTGPEADALNKELSAQAFTTGSDIFFKRGAYEPGSSGGQELIAHELSHVVQQSSGMVSGAGSGMTVRPARDPLEQAADRQSRPVATRPVLRRWEVGPSSHTRKRYGVIRPSGPLVMEPKVRRRGTNVAVWRAADGRSGDCSAPAAPEMRRPLPPRRYVHSMIQRMQAYDPARGDYIASLAKPSPEYQQGYEVSVRTDQGSRVRAYAEPDFERARVMGSKRFFAPRPPEAKKQVEPSGDATHWCHGFSLGTFARFGYSVYSGEPMKQVVSDEYAKVAGVSETHTGVRSGNLVVWPSARGPIHSAILTRPKLRRVRQGGPVRLSRGASLISSKHGFEPVSIDTSLANDCRGYGEDIEFYRKR